MHMPYDPNDSYPPYPEEAHRAAAGAPGKTGGQAEDTGRGDAGDPAAGTRGDIRDTVNPGGRPQYETPFTPPY